jgi:hypothetical protein
MKARVKATGKIVEIVGEGIQNSNMVMAAHGEWFTKDELDIVPLSWKPFEPTYWQKLEHTYAGMAMQGLMTILPNIGGLEGRTPKDEIVDIAMETAHALVEKLKGKEERK